MNAAAGLLTVYFFLTLIQQRFSVSTGSRLLLYLGIMLPTVDYILRFVIGERWFQTDGLVFHSVFYQALFWGVVTLLVWVYNRDLKRAARFLLPFVGFLVYVLFSVFSMEQVSFLTPLSSAAFSLGWILPGYLVPTVLLLLLLGIRLGSDLSKTVISVLAMVLVIVFVGYAGISYHRIQTELDRSLGDAPVVEIVPENHQQTIWRVVIREPGGYAYARFHFIRGQQNPFQSQQLDADRGLSESVLLDPMVRQIYWKSFRSPVIQVESQNKTLLITIRELLPLIEPLWVKQVRIVKDGAGRMIRFEADYGTIL